MISENTETLEALRTERDLLKARLARLESDYRRAVNESQAIYMTALDIMSQVELPSILQFILQRIRGIVQVDASLLYLTEQGSGDLVVSAELDVVPSLLGQRLPADDDSPLHQVQRTGIPLVLNGYGQFIAALHGETFTAYDIAALLPLRWQDEVIGVISLYRTRAEAPFSLDDLDSLQYITIQAAIAVHNAQQNAAEQERNRQLAMLYQASVQVTSSLNLDSVLHTAAISFVEMLRVPICFIHEQQAEEDWQVISHYNSNAQRLFAEALRLALPAQIHALLSRYDWIVLQRNDPMLAPECAHYLDQRQAHSALLLPIHFDDGARGMVELIETDAARQFLISEINTAQALAANISIAISHARLHAQLRAQRINEQAILLDLTRQLLELTTEQEIADAVVNATAEAFQVQHVSLFLRSGDAFALRGMRGWHAEAMAGRLWRADDGTAIGYAIKTRELCVIDDYQTEARFPQPEYFKAAKLRSSMIAPIIYEDVVLGVIAIAHAQPLAFSSDDARLLSLIAYQTAVALDRAHLIASVRAQNLQLEQRVRERTQEISAVQERTVAILFATGESLIVFDQDGKVELVNAAFEEQHGYSSAEARQCTSQALLGFDVLELIKEAQTSDGVPQRVWRGERRVPRRHGEPYEAAITLSRVPNAKGETIGIVASLRDISYLKEVSRMKAHFISNVSHELRTPLANLKLYLHLMQKGSPERRDHYLATMQRESERLGALIEDLLTLSRLDSEHTTVNLQPTDLNALVGNLVMDRQALAEQRGLTLAYTPDSFSVNAMLDARLIMQAVGNLISNAMNYTLSGGAIHVSTLHEEDHVLICVADNGLGIAPEERARLFDRFFRGSAAQQTGAAGTGLGMAIVQEIVMKHGGEITFESEPGKGTTFFVRLPIQPAVERGK
jgi:PAS domain S-box-containing protein